MASVQVISVDETSPRSIVLGGSEHMNTKSGSPMNDSNLASGLPDGDTRLTAPSNGASDTSQRDPNAMPLGKETPKAGEIKGQGSNLSPPPENRASAPMQHYQTISSGYYLGYQSDAPPSPVVSGHVVTALPYDTGIGSFIHQPGTFAAVHSSPFGVPSANTPLSPPRTTASSGMMGVPPASPLFPRVNSSGLDGGVAPQSPSLPYMSPALGSYGIRMSSQAGSDEWDRSQSHNAYPSPQFGSQAMIYGVMPRSGGRAYSFDGESMLPSAVLDDQTNPAYSPYSAAHSSPGGAALFTHQQAWSYPGPPPDMYTAPGSPLQPRPQMSMYAGSGPMAAGMRQMAGPYGVPQQFYPSSSPGPPIQTTASNKGPDGANLFIFHIPNHFTNIDMYNLFCHYGNLLSVRIMVEKDTGRSRGFGFVSYDNPESAAAAIKELNGYTIGNKRLKVQHKQIRPRDLHERDGSQGSGVYGHPGESGSYGRTFGSSLPPSGPGSNAQDLWYDPRETDESGLQTPTTAVAAAVAHSTESMSHIAESVGSAEDNSGERANTASLGKEMNPTSPLDNLGSLQSTLPDVSVNSRE